MENRAEWEKPACISFSSFVQFVPSHQNNFPDVARKRYFQLFRSTAPVLSSATQLPKVETERQPASADSSLWAAPSHCGATPGKWLTHLMMLSIVEQQERLRDGATLLSGPRVY